MFFLVCRTSSRSSTSWLLLRSSWVLLGLSSLSSGRSLCWSTAMVTREVEARAPAKSALGALVRPRLELEPDAEDELPQV